MLRQDEAAVPADIRVIMPEVRRRLADWQGLLGQETARARKMLRTLLEGRIVFTLNVEERSCLFQAGGNYEELFRGLISVPKALASPGDLSWNHILGWLREMQSLRESVGDAA